MLKDLVPLLNVRSVGKAFRALRVVPWGDGVDEREAVGPSKKAPSGSVAKERDSERRSRKKEGWRMEPGQVYLPMNAWMKAAWPYE